VPLVCHIMIRSISIAFPLLAAIAFGQENTPPPSALTQFSDLKTLPDSSAALQKQLDENEGNLILKRGIYRLTTGLEIDLTKYGAVLVKPENGAVTLIMDGPGPAIRIAGSHEGSASPTSFKPETWNERSKGVKTDKLDALALCQRLDRFALGNRKAFSIVRVPTRDEGPEGERRGTKESGRGRRPSAGRGPVATVH